MGCYKPSPGILNLLPVIFYIKSGRKTFGIFQHHNFWSGFKTSFYLPFSYFQSDRYQMGLVVRFEYLNLYLVIIGWSWFVVNLYSSKFARIAAWFITILFLAASCLTLFLPVSIFSYSAVVYYPLMILLICYLLYKSFLATLKKSGLDFLYFLAFILLFLGGLHDLRV